MFQDIWHERGHRGSGRTSRLTPGASRGHPEHCSGPLPAGFEPSFLLVGVPDPVYWSLYTCPRIPVLYHPRYTMPVPYTTVHAVPASTLPDPILTVTGTGVINGSHGTVTNGEVKSG